MKHHLFIAGTGRAGTSFLVQYLHACGLDTQLTLNPDARLDEVANAGLEDYPTKGATLPYVLKSPWLFEFVDKLLARDDLTVDGVILPMRDLIEAASSRVILEMRARYGASHLNDDICQWENWGLTPGGVIYSLNPIDQARILALGFHETVFAFVKRQIPIVFVDFNRMISDADYLWESLEPIIGTKTNRERALRAHADTADAKKIRVSRDAIGQHDAASTDAADATVTAIRYPARAELDRDAILRELKTVRTARQTAEAELAATRESLAATGELLAGCRKALDSAQESLRVQNEHCDARIAALNAGMAQMEQNQSQSAEALAALQAARYAVEEQREKLSRSLLQSEQEAQALRENLAQVKCECESHTLRLEKIIAALKASRSWQITRPLRELASFLSRQPK